MKITQLVRQIFELYIYLLKCMKKYSKMGNVNNTYRRKLTNDVF